MLLSMWLTAVVTMPLSVVPPKETHVPARTPVRSPDADPPRAVVRRRRFGATGRRPWRAVALAIGTALAAAPAASAGIVGSGTDPTGDAVSPVAAHDIVGVAVALDPRTGRMQAQVRLRGEPTTDAPADLNLFAGRRQGSACTAFPAVGFSTLDTARGARGVRLDGAGREPRTGAASKSGGGEAVQEFEAQLPIFRGVRPNCVVARTANWTDTRVVYDVAGPFPLRGIPGLEAGLQHKSLRLRPGQTRKLRLTLRNPGQAKTGRVRITTAKARGLTVRGARSVGSIAAGKRRTVTLRVSLSSRAQASTTLTVRASAPGKLQAEASATLYRRSPPSSGGGGSDGPKLCYRYTWRPPYGELQLC